MDPFSSRSTQSEMLDTDLPAKDVLDSLNFMIFVNTFFGGKRTVLNYFEKHGTPEKFSVLDLGSGAGDIPFALARWAAKRKKEVQITAIDLNPHCQAYAKTRFACPQIKFIRHSAFDLDTLGHFDYIISSMFFHHLPDEEIVRLLDIVRRHSRRGFLISDLYRCRRNYWGALLLAGLTFKKVIINDAALSVLRAFKEKDFMNYRKNSKVSFEIQRHPLFRVVMSRHDLRPD